MAERRLALAIVLSCTLACAGAPWDRSRSPASTGLDDPRSARGVHLELIERMISAGRSYAALAHLDALLPDLAAGSRSDRLHADWLRAEALRHLGAHEEAIPRYENLLRGPFAGLAHRGLGLIAAAEGRPVEARTHLETARELRPTDARIRNDLGYAWLLAGDLARARVELLTAAELDDSAPTVTANVLLLLHTSGDTRAADAWARRQRIDRATEADVIEEARRIASGWRDPGPEPPPEDDAADDATKDDPSEDATEDPSEDGGLEHGFDASTRAAATDGP